MNTITINGIEFNDLGTNNYSNGMRLVSIYPMPENIVADVLAGKYPDLYLNPSSPCDSEFYGVYGTPEQYKEFYNDQRKSQICNQIIRTIDFDDPYYSEKVAEIESNYRDWWEALAL